MSSKKISIHFNPKLLYGFDNYKELCLKRNLDCTNLCRLQKIKKVSFEIDRSLFSNKKYKLFVAEYKQVFSKLTSENTDTVCKISNKKLNNSDKNSPLYPIVQPMIPIYVLFVNKIPTEYILQNNLYYTTAQSLQFDRYISFVE